MSEKGIRTLKLGMAGADVQVVQKALNARHPHMKHPHGKLLRPDGVFGKKTHQEVIALQDRTGCQARGLVDMECRSVLFPLVTATTTVSLLRMRERAFPLAGPPPGGLSSKVHLVPQLTRPSLAVDESPFLGLERPSSNPVHWELDEMPVPKIPGLKLPVPRIPQWGKFQYDSTQAQTGASANLRPLDQNGNSIMVIQAVFARKRLHSASEEQQQLTLGAQIQGPFTIPADDGKTWTLSAFTQFTWADAFLRYGRWHLAQPFAQITGQYDNAHHAFGVSAGLFPININFDLDRRGNVSIFAQGGLLGILSQQARADGTLHWAVQGGPTLGWGVTFKL
jgi:hypothetical protein